MPFGLVNAPVTFHKADGSCPVGPCQDICQIYLDDVLVGGKTLQEHNQKLAKVLDWIRGAVVKLKPKKYRFA